MNKEALKELVKRAFQEDIKDGDHSSLASVPKDEVGRARLLVKQEGIISGIDVAEFIFNYYDNEVTFIKNIYDGEVVAFGDVAFEVKGKAQSILACERILLNCMQRMSGISTYTHSLNQKIKHTNAKLLDTRKTTPNFRLLEKEAVKIGGGMNHRFGLYDMVMLKDNHIDYAGGIAPAIEKTVAYLKNKNLDLKIEVEVRNLRELQEVLAVGQVNRIMLDNFSTDDMKTAVAKIDGKFETEASGGITEDDIADYAETGVDFISVGALTHQVKSLDLSLKAC
ncbi:MAG: nicotinate-nucleotide pyrophosphorylase (carboxylating) [Glaciecola sp.]|jgi:nicotinate-nucleotide pyrophosphorylase (carboxylating)